MKNNSYKPAKYTVEIEIAKSPYDVFNHLIDLKKWWPEDFEGEDLKQHSEFIFTIGEWHYSKNQVIEFIPDQKLAWLTMESIRKSDGYDWTGTKFIFELTPQSENTLLRFTYDGVVLEDESERLVQICDMTLKGLFYDYINHERNQ